MRDSGVSIMGTARAEGEGRARKAVDEALNSPLLEDNDIRGAKHILLNITSGAKEVTMDEIYEITEFIQDEAGYDTDLIWGNCIDESLGDAVCVTVIATGFEHRKSMEEIVEQKREKIVVSLEDEKQTAKSRGLYETSYKEGDYKKTFDLDIATPVPSYSTPQQPHGDPYVRASVNNHQQEKNPSEQNLSWREQQMKEELRARNKKLNNPQAVIDLENEPAYLRRKVELDDVPHSSEIIVSRWSITGDEEPEIRRDNPYLHDKMD
jgi:cell division protein FtsZ